MIGVVVDLILFVVAIVLIKKYKKPNPGALLMVQPGRKFNRLQQAGLNYAAIGVITAVGIELVNRFHPMNIHLRAGELGLSEGFILIGVVSFLFGRKYRRSPDISESK